MMRLLMVSVLVLGVTSTGCRKARVQDKDTTANPPPTTPSVASVPPTAPPKAKEEGPTPEKIMRVVPVGARMLDATALKNFGVLVVQFRDENGRNPTSLDDFRREIFGKQREALQEEYIIDWTAMGEQVFAFHKSVPASGGMILLANGQVTRVAPGEFQPKK